MMYSNVLVGITISRGLFVFSQSTDVNNYRRLTNDLSMLTRLLKTSNRSNGLLTHLVKTSIRLNNLLTRSIKTSNRSNDLLTRSLEHPSVQTT